MKKIFFDLVIITVLSVFFLVIFFLIQLFFFDTQSFPQHIEQNYIEKTSQEIDLNALYKTEQQRSQHILAQQIKKESLQSEKIQAFLQKKQSQTQKKDVILPYQFIYIPTEISGTIGQKVDGIRYFLETDFTQIFLKSLLVNYYQKVYDVRGKMKDGMIHIFGVENLPDTEILALFIHEFAHYVDIYSFESDFIQRDISSDFYDISWESTKVLSPGQQQKDFVSGYAMTNKYEDFAESFTYYVLHNKDFVEKSQKSEILADKYTFFTDTVFRSDVFVGTDFSQDAIILDYYRDITKIEFNLKIFLQYLGKFI